jgi:NitT/TauT family transport system substrate-binding protein
MNRRSFTLSTGLGLICGLSGRSGAAFADQTLQPLLVAYDGFSMTTAPMYYASKIGLFQKYGFDPSLMFIQGGSTLSQAGVGGSIDIAQNGYTPAVAADVQGGNLVIIGGISNSLPFQLVVTSKIKSGNDLRGKKIAISKFGSSTDIAADFALAHLGLSRDEVTVLQLGGEGSRTAALLSGEIEGSLEQYPRTAELDAQGCHVLVDVTDINTDYPNTAYVTTRQFLAGHKDVVKRFLQVIIEGVHAYKASPQQAMAVTAEFLNAPQNAALVETYKFYTTKIFPNIPWPSISGVGQVLNLLAKTDPAAANVKPEQLVDLSPLQELKSEGFLTKFQ